MLDNLHRFVLHLPLLTTVCSAIFCYQLFSRYRAKGGGLHLLWWGIGMLTYGLGTLTESLTTLFGWQPLVFRTWYVAGAFLGGYPLAQGSIYLLMGRRFAHRSAWIVSSLIAVAAVFVFLTPLDASLAEAHRLSGRVIEWSWIRLISPFINLYAVVFLVGGAVISALRFRRSAALRNRYVGNILIAVGALLPGIGGAMTRAGVVEALYVTELAGLLLIYAGYRKNVAGRVAAAAPVAIADLTARRGVAASWLVPLLLLSLLPAVPVAAQGPDDDDTAVASRADDDAGSEEIRASFFATTTVTATGREENAFEISTPVSVLEAEEIERKMPENAADILRSQPGVDVDGVGPNQARPIIRGQRGLRVLFLENGLRLNNPRRQTDFGEIPGLVSMDSVETVEVVRGPASVLYGTDAIGGVLNLITRVPGSRDGAALQGSIGLRYVTASEQLRFQSFLDGRGDRFSFNVGVTARDSSDYDAPDGTFGRIRLAEETPVVDTGVDDDSLFGYLGYRPSDRHAFSLRLNRYRAERSGFGFVEPERLDSAADFRIRITYPFQDFDRFTLGYQGSMLELPLADSVDARIYYQDNERELANDIDINIGPLFPGAPDSSVEADTLNFTDLETFGLRAEMIKGFGTDNLLTYGVEYFQDDSFNTDFSTTTTTLRFPGPPFALVDVSTDAVPNAPNAENISYGIFVQDEIFAGERLRITLGARYQTVETRAKPTPGIDTAGLDFDDDTVVGALNLVYGLTDNLRLVGSYGTAFRAPNIVERLFNGPTPEGAGFQILNPDLTSEESTNFDIGLKYLRRNAIFELTYFQNDIDDGIIQYFLTPDDIAALPPDVQREILTLGVSFVVQQRNIDRLRFEGVETVIGYRWDNGVTIGGNYTHLDGERRDSLNPPTGDTFSDQYNAYVRYEPPAGRYWLEYRVRHNGDADVSLQPGEPAPLVGSVLPSFTVHTLSGGVTLSDRGRGRHTLALLVDNVTDELYAEFSNASFFRPQPQRSVAASYRYSF